MRRFGLIGVPYTSMARPGGIADAIGVLRELGLAERLAPHEVEDRGDLTLPAPDGVRGPSGLLNENALGELVEQVAGEVRSAHADGCLPLLVGGDCPVILGALAGLGEGTGLILVDGHEDAWPPGLSFTGEASDSEVAIALGLVDAPLPPPLDTLVPLLNPGELAMLGPRDRAEIESGGAKSIGSRIAYFRDDKQLEKARGRALSAALDRIGTNRFWLHIDLDVLDSESFPAVDCPQPGGVSSDTLSSVMSRALRDSRCAGASIVIYNPDLDPDHESGRWLVHFLAIVLARVHTHQRVLEAGHIRWDSDPDDGT